MPPMTADTVATTTRPGPLAEAFARLDTSSPLHAMRRASFDRFLATGFPTVREERWRYTNVKPIATAPLGLAADARKAVDAAALTGLVLPDGTGPRLVFVNGRFAPALSRPDGAGAVRVERLADVIARDFAAVERHLAQHTRYEDDAFMSLNTAFIEDGVFVHVPRGVVLEAPIEAIFLTVPGAEPAITTPRLLVVAEPNCQATVIERYATRGDGPGLTNALTEIVAGHDAVIDHYKVQQESQRAWHYSSLQVAASAARVTSHTFTFGGALVRNNVDAQLEAEHTEVVLNGLYLTRGTQHVDNHLRVDHRAPHCRSWQFYKGVLDDRSRGVFCGRIFVEQDAQKTDAMQTNMNLLLAKTAHVDTKPQLEIFADDVKCSHGATVGQLEESQLFYLRARGIDAAAARGMLIHAFANAVVAETRVDALRGQLEDVLLERLPRGERHEDGR